MWNKAGSANFRSAPAGIQCPDHHPCEDPVRNFPSLLLSLYQERFQLIGFAVSVLVCGLIAAAPNLGLCNMTVTKEIIGGEGNTDEITICGFEDKSEVGCKAFFGILLALGFILPVLSVIILYIYNLHPPSSHQGKEITQHLDQIFLIIG